MYYSIRDIQDLIGVSNTTILKWIRNGELPVKSIRSAKGMTKFLVKDIDLLYFLAGRSIIRGFVSILLEYAQDEALSDALRPLMK